MRYLSVCSGIEAATVAWHQLGWTPVAYSEIEKFPASVLAHHCPQTPNLGDMNNYKEWNIGDIDLLVGGTPCQSFSVAGLRKGLDDPRGNLALVYLGIAERFHPRWLLWENVPGVLSSNGGRDFGSFLGAMAQLGYGFAYRVLDAQYFGVPQRRRRVFVVGHLGDWRRAAAVLFESHSLQGHPAPSREKREEATGNVAINIDEECNATMNGTGPLLRGGHGGIAEALAASAGMKQTNYVCYDTTNITSPQNGSNPKTGDPCFTLAKGQHPPLLCAQPAAVAFGVNESPELGHCLRSGASKADKHESTTYISQQMQVRRLTPTECERLQGFQDNYTNIPWRKKEESPDGPRYKALGNSMAVPVMRWIGERIQMVDEI